jgi:hypothetical protein
VASIASSLGACSAGSTPHATPAPADGDGGAADAGPSPDSIESSDAASVDGGAIADASMGCLVEQAGPSGASSLASMGFDGGASSYFALFASSCEASPECVGSCVAAGGSPSPCSTSSCVAAGDDGGTCVPPDFWVTETAAATPGSVELTLAAGDYHDPLVVDGFGLSIPDGATILGIRFEVTRSSDDAFATDESVRVLRGGLAVGTDHASAAAWSSAAGVASYGGAYDTWGMDWSPADVASPAFGVALRVAYGGPSAGIDRAHVEGARATVYYRSVCK